MISRLAAAKVNFALHVTGLRDDGYHLLDSLVVFTAFGDKISVSEPHHPHGPISITMDGPFADNLDGGHNNLVSMAAMLLRQSLLRDGNEPAPVEIHLDKNLPIASGIGGGSADAAATLLALAEFWNTDIDLVPIALAIGADVPMCLASKPLRAQGIGDKLTPLTMQTGLHLVLVNPGIEVPTPSVFRALEARDNPAIELETEIFPTVDQLCLLRNDLQPPAKGQFPVIADVLSALEGSGASLARMSGSGATCFGIFEDGDRTAIAREQIVHDHPDWWCVATQTIVP